MPSPFPGMDPYIENPNVWPSFHHLLISHMVETLNDDLPPNYVAEPVPRVEIGLLDAEDTRSIYPDVAVIEGPQLPEPVLPSSTSISPATVELVGQVTVEPPVSFIQIKDYPADRVVTIIEVLSPINKHPGNRAHEEYLDRRDDILQSRVHLLELDLLRKGKRLLADKAITDAPYYALLTRASRGQYTRTLIWAIQLEEPLPVLPVPLLRGDADIPLDLGVAVQRTYDGAKLDRRLDYTQPPLGPLTDAQRAYLDALLAPLRTPES